MAKNKAAHSRPTIYLTDKKHIGPGLKQIRVSQGLIQRDVASAANMDPTHIGDYENNHTVPTTWKLLQLMKAHGYAVVLVPLESCPEWVK